MSKSLLAEFEYGIAHLPFVLPNEEKEKVVATLVKLKSDPDVAETAIKQAMFEVGIFEYPYRNAYKEVFAQKEEGEFLGLVLKMLEEGLEGKFESFLAGRSLKEGMNDAAFMETFVPEERQLIEQAVNESKQKISEVMMPEIQQDKQLFEHALKRHEEMRDRLLQLIKEISALSEIKGEWQDELRAVLERAREGFLVTERDPELEELVHLKDYWQEEIGKRQ